MIGASGPADINATCVVRIRRAAKPGDFTAPHGEERNEGVPTPVVTTTCGNAHVFRYGTEMSAAFAAQALSQGLKLARATALEGARAYAPAPEDNAILLRYA